MFSPKKHGDDKSKKLAVVDRINRTRSERSLINYDDVPLNTSNRSLDDNSKQEGGGNRRGSISRPRSASISFREKKKPPLRRLSSLIQLNSNEEEDEVYEEAIRVVWEDEPEEEGAFDLSQYHFGPDHKGDTESVATVEEIDDTIEKGHGDSEGTACYPASSSSRSRKCPMVLHLFLLTALLAAIIAFSTTRSRNNKAILSSTDTQQEPDEPPPFVLLDQDEPPPGLFVPEEGSFVFVIPKVEIEEAYAVAMDEDLEIVGSDGATAGAASSDVKESNDPFIGIDASEAIQITDAYGNSWFHDMGIQGYIVDVMCYAELEECFAYYTEPE